MRDRARRFPRRVQVRFWPEVAPERSYAGYSRNISMTGMFIATIYPMKPGTRLLLELQDGGETFTLRARVVHSAKVSPLLQSVRPSGMGVRFTDRSVGLERLLPAEAIQSLDEDDRLIYPIYFSEPVEFVETFDRDIRNGGLFVPTARPAAMDQEISVELNVPWEGQRVFTFIAKVVHRVPSGAGAGMGIAFKNLPSVVAELGAIAGQMRARQGGAESV